MSEKVRFHANITGLVQGVFFRMETKRAADSFNVRGWVKNRYDSTVEAVFEGDREDVRKVLNWCKKGPTASDVEDVKLTEQTYSGEFNSFDVTF